MTIEKAILKLFELKGELQEEGRLEKVAAVWLGIEVLRRLQEGRAKGYDFFAHLLPGETEE